ncbi:MAG TPA: acyl-CoA dehydrogenase [Burkholderiales bacterium]|nr:acyl-CoA dehydrogenase [Burkholderiales bacterium]
MRTFWWNTDCNVGPMQEALRARVHAFARECIRPAALAWDRMPQPQPRLAVDSPYWEVLKGAYEQGWHSALIPSGLGGGLGLRGVDLHILYEELGWGSADIAVSLILTGLPFSYLAAARKMDLIEEVVKPFAADRKAKLIGCWALSEPEHGSDQFGIGTEEFSDLSMFAGLRSYPDGDEYVINGEKSAWVSNAAIASHMLASLMLISDRSVAGNAIVLIPLDLPGVSVEPPVDMMGQRALAQAAVRFKDVRVPRRYVLVEDARYESELVKTLGFINAAMGAIFTGVARAAFEAAFEHARERVQGGKRLLDHQLVQKRLFEMYSAVEACRAISRAAMLYDEATGPLLERAIAAKTYCTGAAFQIADSALTLAGAQGLTHEHLLGKLFRDARVSLIECGSNDVLALLAARRLASRSPQT